MLRTISARPSVRLSAAPAVLIGAAFALFHFLQQQKAAQEQQQTAQKQFSQQQKAAHDLLISNQVSKGFEQLASDKMAMRLGGIYGLEGVMNTSEQYRGSVLEGLCAFVRENTTASDTRARGPSVLRIPLEKPSGRVGSLVENRV